jgi:hypothetical protein
MKNRKTKIINNRNIYGSISILVLVFGMIVTVAIGGLAIVAATQYTSATRTEVYEKALSIAQAGAEYYRWHLAHDPIDFRDATMSAAPYIHKLTDPYGNTQGTFSLTITPPASGSSIVTISSTGWIDAYQSIKRTVVAKYGIPSLAKYSFLHNANVWFGSGLTVHGKVMSNGGIRMDGVNDSLIQSSKNTYTCGTETGCSPSTTKNGVWGSGGPSALWQFPIPAVDFNSLQVDFSNMRTQAQTSGIYLGASGSYGYHLTFINNGTVNIKKVTGATNQKGWSVENDCENLYQQITTETNVGTYSLATKPIIFAEDHLWINGVVNGRATVVAAKFPLISNYMNIWLNDNLTYLAKDGHSQLGILAQNNIYIRLNVPTDFEVDAALLAGSGRIIRHNYHYSGCSTYGNAVRNSFTLYGSVISNQKSYWNFGTQPDSGFTTRDITYDPNLYFQPPPYFPSQGEYEFISWEEK